MTRGRRLRRSLVRTGLWLAALWALTCAALIVLARPLVYPFEAGASAAVPAGLPGARAATLTATDGLALTVWLRDPSPGRPVVLFFMGNGGVLARYAPALAELAAKGFGIAALNYRGAAGTPGKPSQQALTADALALYDGLEGLFGLSLPAERRVIWGRSLGAAVAVQLAARRPAAALVLDSPFNRLCEAAQIHYPIFPVCLVLPYEHWDSAAVIGGIAAPLLVLHGEADEVIPFAQGRLLFEAAAGPKRLISYPGRGHNDLAPVATVRDGAAFLDEILGH